MIVVVAGTGRKAGKTSVTAGIIAALPDLAWTAVKISRHEHGQGWGRTEEQTPSATDTGRFLAAGARRAVWIRAADDAMAEAAAEVERIAAASVNTIVESNSVLRYLATAALVILVVDSSRELKPSAVDAMRRADAVVVPEARAGAPMRGARCFVAHPPQYVAPALAHFVRERLATAKTNRLV